MMEPIITISFDLREEDQSILRVRGSKSHVRIVPLHGTATGPIFHGEIEPFGTNIQIAGNNGVLHMMGHFILIGEDSVGVPTRIFIENEGWFDGSIGSIFRTTPHFISDNPRIEELLAGRTYRGRGTRTASGLDMSFFETTEASDSGLSAQDIADIERFEYMHFKKGEYLIRQGEKADQAFFLMSGNVKVSQITSKGDSLVYDIRHSDQGLRRFLGVLSSYRPENQHRNSFVAATDVYCYRMTCDQVHNYMLQHPNVLAGFMSLVMERYVWIEESFLFKQARNTPGQVCLTIVNYMVQHGDSYWMSPEMTNTKISRVTGANRVTVVKIVQELFRLGLLERSEEGTRIVDVEKLKEIARGEMTIKYNRNNSCGLSD